MRRLLLLLVPLSWVLGGCMQTGVSDRGAAEKDKQIRDANAALEGRKPGEKRPTDDGQ